MAEVLVLADAALPSDLRDGQFPFPDEFKSVLDAAAVEVVDDRRAKLFLELLVDVPLRVVELLLQVGKRDLALVILLQIGHDAHRKLYI